MVDNSSYGKYSSFEHQLCRRNLIMIIDTLKHVLKYVGIEKLIKKIKTGYVTACSYNDTAQKIYLDITKEIILIKSYQMAKRELIEN
jgi:hypothetical protein